MDYEVNIAEEVLNYLNQIVDSEYTENANPVLRIPVEIRVVQNGVIVADLTQYYDAEAALNLKESVEISAAVAVLVVAYRGRCAK